jgi:ribokinase
MVDVVVVGSINMDLVVKTTRIPVPGETLHGSNLQMIPGGKGGNQAACVAKLGVHVAMLGKVGGDAFGHTLINELAAASVNTENIQANQNLETGTAMIIVDQNGQNSIVVSPGANGRITKADILAKEQLICQAKILLLQFEIPLDAVSCAVDLANKHGVKVILNPAPARAVSREFLSKIDIIVPNETEASFLSGVKVVDLASSLKAANTLLDQGVKAVIITMGEKGALLATSIENLYVPAIEVRVEDTTAAGDAFMGGLSAALINRYSLEDAVRYATCASALTVTKFGAQTSLPTKAEVNQLYQKVTSIRDVELPSGA